MKKLWKFYFNIRNVVLAGHFINTSTYCFRAIQIQGKLGLQIYIFTATKGCKVVKATIFQVYGILAWWEKALSLSLSLFYLPSTSLLLAYLGTLCLTTWKAFWGVNDWSKIWWNSLTTRSLEAGQEYLYIYSIYFPFFLWRWGNKMAFPGAEKCSNELSGCSCPDSAARPSLGMPWACGHGLSCTGRQQPGASGLCWEALIHLLCTLDLS